MLELQFESSFLRLKVEVSSLIDLTLISKKGYYFPTAER